MSTSPDALGGVEGRVALTRFGDSTSLAQIPPAWWNEWCRGADPGPAAWLLDGVDEGLARTAHLLDRVLAAVRAAPDHHRYRLRLVLLSRPHAELEEFRDRLGDLLLPPEGRLDVPTFWLTRLDRGHAGEIVGAPQFDAVCELIRRNGLSPIAGYPVVVRFLSKYPETARLGISDVWRGVIQALLGEPGAAPAARFQTNPDERFDAAARVAAVLYLTGRDAVRGYSPDPAAVTIGGLFEPAAPRLQAAADEATQTAAFVQLPERGAYRFAQRNVQDWLTAFALERLPVGALASALPGPDGRIAPRLGESARLLHRITTRAEVRAAVDRLDGGAILPSDAADPTLAEAVRCLDRLEEFARSAHWGLRLDDNVRELARLADGLAGLVEGIRLPPPLREDQVARRQRLDLRVQAPCRDGRSVATVVVEIKWSDNPETRSGLVEQLGTRYLLGEGLQHGVYIVGWNGRWKSGGRSSANRDVQRLRDELARQRDEFCHPGAEGHGLMLAPYVLDLRWDASR